MPLCTNCHRDVPDGALFCSFCGAGIKPPTAAGEAVDPLIGQTVSGKYFVHQLLGRGGMGDVYKATHLTLDRPVVLKLLKKSFLNDPSIVQRFHREARAASRLNHPNSVTIIDFGQTEEGTLFMAMEYLAGRSLARVIAEDYPLAELRVIHIGNQILAALVEAHNLGIIHRDLKPDNVMLESRRDESDFVKVLDFGIAKLNEPGDTGGKLTQAGIVCGTPGYMSPEQVRGDELDARSDLYAVGVILYEMLSGKLPFEADTPMGLVTKHLVEMAPRPSVRRPGLEISPALEELVMRCLAKDREQRYASAEDLRAALAAIASAPAGPTRPTPAPSAHATMVLKAAQATPAADIPAAVKGTGGFKNLKPEPRPQTGTTALPSSGRGPGRGPTPAPRQTTPAPSPRPPTPAPQRGGTATATPPRAAEERSDGLDDTLPPDPQFAAPARRTRPAARKTPPPARRAPRHEVDDESQESIPPPPAAGSKVPLIAGGAAAVLLLGGVGIYFATRPSEPKPSAPVVQAPAPVPQPAPQAPPATPAPVAIQAPAPTPPAPASPPPPVAAPTPAPSPQTTPAATASRPPPPAHQAPTAPRSNKGVRLIREELNSIPVPPAASGDGVLAVIATPWAIVEIDGREVGETPREIRLGAGSYRLKTSHPTLGTREDTVRVAAGKRVVFNANMAN